MHNRRSIFDFPRNEAGLVDEFIGTAFDVVYQIYVNLEEVLKTGDHASSAKASAIAAAASELAAEQFAQGAGSSAVEAAESAKAAAMAVVSALEAAENAQSSEEAAEISANITATIRDEVEAMSGRFLPASAIPPVARQDGSPLQEGDRYFNTALKSDYYYTGNTWLSTNSSAGLLDLEETLQNRMDPTKGGAYIGTRLPSPSLLTLAIGRAVTDKLYDSISIKDFVTPDDIVDENNPAADWYNVCVRAAAWTQLEVASRARGTRIHFPAGKYPMSDLAVFNIAPINSAPGTGMVSLHITGDGDTATVFVARPENTRGCLRLTSERNTECFRVDNMSFLSDLDEDAPTNNGIALQIDSQLEKGAPGYGDHPRWSVQIHNVFVGGYGTSAGNLARRGNWKEGIHVRNKWYPQFKNVRCLARYTGNLETRTACDYAIRLYNCYSPDFSDTYVHGNWDNGIFLGDLTDPATGGWEDFRFFNTFCVGPNYGITIDHPYTDPSVFRLYEPGGAIMGLHLNCRRFGLTIRNHRQVMIDGVYGYSPNAARRQGEMLPAVILLDGASDIRLKGQILEPGFYNSNTDSSVGVRIEGNSEAISLDLQLGSGGIGVLNNSTSANKSILVDIKLRTSRRNSAWTAPLVPVVDNANGVTYNMNDLGGAQDRMTSATGKYFSPSYPIAHRVLATAPSQMYGGAYEIACVNSANAVVNQFILSARWTVNTAGSEDSLVSFFLQGAGGIKEAFRLSPTTVDNETYGTLLCRVGGNNVFRRVTLGPPDSGGTGYRYLRVPN